MISHLNLSTTRDGFEVFKFEKIEEGLYSEAARMIHSALIYLFRRYQSVPKYSEEDILFRQVHFSTGESSDGFEIKLFVNQRSISRNVPTAEFDRKRGKFMHKFCGTLWINQTLTPAEIEEGVFHIPVSCLVDISKKINRVCDRISSKEYDAEQGSFDGVLSHSKLMKTLDSLSNTNKNLTLQKTALVKILNHCKYHVASCVHNEANLFDGITRLTLIEEKVRKSIETQKQIDDFSCKLVVILQDAIFRLMYKLRLLCYIRFCTVEEENK